MGELLEWWFPGRSVVDRRRWGEYSPMEIYGISKLMNSSIDGKNMPMDAPSFSSNRSRDGWLTVLSLLFITTSSGQTTFLYTPRFQSWLTSLRASSYIFFINTLLIDRYYAIACALVLSVLNWVLVGIFSDVLDLFYLESWQVFLTCKYSAYILKHHADMLGIVIFSGLSNVSSALFQYRLNANSIGNALISNFKWVIFFFFFFCGLPYHLSTAL